MRKTIGKDKMWKKRSDEDERRGRKETRTSSRRGI